MLKQPITYMTYDDTPVEVTEPFYFNLSKPELLEMEVDVQGGMGKFLQRIIDETDNKKILEFFKKFILAAYGKRTDDGKNFRKSDELRKDFSESAAYEALYTQCMTDAKFGAEFMEGILPKDLDEFAKKVKDQDKPAPGPPTTTTN